MAAPTFRGRLHLKNMHNLEREFYDWFYPAGAYLPTHAEAYGTLALLQLTSIQKQFLTAGIFVLLYEREHQRYLS